MTTPDQHAASVVACGFCSDEDGPFARVTLCEPCADPGALERARRIAVHFEQENALLEEILACHPCRELFGRWSRRLTLHQLRTRHLGSHREAA